MHVIKIRLRTLQGIPMALFRIFLKAMLKCKAGEKMN